MSAQLQEVINLTESLSFPEQLKLLTALSQIIQKAHAEENSARVKNGSTDFSSERFRSSWKQAVSGQTLPVSELWDD